MYVGQTWHDPEVRFQQHKDGYKASRIVRKYGKRLLRKKYDHLNPPYSQMVWKRGDVRRQVL